MGNQQITNQNTLKCSICQQAIRHTKGQLYFEHDPIKICHGVLCVQCCHNKILQWELKPGRNDDGALIECCKSYAPGLITAIKEFLNLNCLICGPQCTSQKIILKQTGVHVGKYCFHKLQNKGELNRLDYQNNLVAYIQSLSYVNCIICFKQKYNIFEADIQDKQLRICKDCYKGSFNKQFQKQMFEKKCYKCKQIQVFKSYPTLFWNQIKLLSLQPSNHKNIRGQIQFYCSSCKWKEYKDFQEQLLKREITDSQMRQKIEFQKYFVQYCRICANQCSSKSNIFIVPNQDPYYVFSFLCQECIQALKTNHIRYQALNQLQIYLKHENQFEKIDQKLQIKENFNKLCDQLIGQIKAKLQKLNQENIVAHIQVRKRYCQDCNSRQIINCQQKILSSVFSTRKIKNYPFLLVQFNSKILCYVCIFKRIFIQKNLRQNNNISKINWIQKKIEIQKLLSLKCFICGYSFQSEVYQKMYILSKQIKCEIEVGYCLICHIIIFNGGSMPNKAFMNIKQLIYEGNAWQKMKILEAGQPKQFTNKSKQKLKQLQNQLREENQQVLNNKQQFIQKINQQNEKQSIRDQKQQIKLQRDEKIQILKV